MKVEILNICPDCGGNLEGNICNECNSEWKFKLSKSRDKLLQKIDGLNERLKQLKMQGESSNNKRLKDIRKRRNKRLKDIRKRRNKFIKELVELLSPITSYYDDEKNNQQNKIGERLMFRYTS